MQSMAQTLLFRKGVVGIWNPSRTLEIERSCYRKVVKHIYMNLTRQFREMGCRNYITQLVVQLIKNRLMQIKKIVIRDLIEMKGHPPLPFKGWLPIPWKKKQPLLWKGRPLLPRNGSPTINQISRVGLNFNVKGISLANPCYNCPSLLLIN